LRHAGRNLRAVEVWSSVVAGGLTNDEIARKLYMSPATVRTHVSRAMTKLGVRDRAQLVVLAYETGLVRPNWLT
jgi:DNA-binding NarL/FixJ family response regulator